MTFLDEHLEWMQDLGLPVKAMHDVRRWPAIEQDLPEEIGLWFDQACHERTLPFHALGFVTWEGGWSHPSLDDSGLISEHWHKERQAGLTPLRPIGFATYTMDIVSIETVGDRAGWVYVNDWIDPDRWGGPVCRSLSEWFKAVRTLTAVGVLDPTSETGRGRHKAPIDTPSWLVKPIALTKPVGRDDDINDDPPLPGSIQDILPDFEFLHPLVPDDKNPY